MPNEFAPPSRSRAARLAPVGVALASWIGLAAPALAQWATSEAGGRVEAGTTVDGRFAGILLRCPEPGEVALTLTHNGARFDRARDYTLVMSVDGVATLLPARAVQGERAGDDDFVHTGTLLSLDPLLTALARGGAVEVAAPSGRYTLPLAGSARAVEAFRRSCAVS